MKAFRNISSTKILYLSIFSFIFISSFALSTTKLYQTYEEPVILENVTYKRTDFPPIPVLKNSSKGQPSFTAESVLATDIDSGVTLYEKNPDQKLLPASTTKMITALTALDYYPLDKVVRIGKIKVDGQKMNLHEGEEMKVGDLISGLLIYSANDAAEALAAGYCDPKAPVFISGKGDGLGACGREYFINAMNEKALSLHLDNSHFLNPSGLDIDGHLSTARDLTRIADAGMKNQFFREVVGTKQTVVSSLDGKRKHKLTNLNKLIGEVSGVLGVKTGWTENAKENLVTYIERDGRKVIVVLLRSDDRFGESKLLIDWIFDNYEWKKVKI